MAETCCQMCGRPLERLETQYIATIAIRPTVGAIDCDEDPGDRDYLMEMHEMLEREAEGELVEALDEGPAQSELLLCSDCCRRFGENPLPRETALQLDFSEN